MILSYSFDDFHIGTIKPGGSSLFLRVIERPRGLLKDEWYKFAARVCEILNAGGQ